MQTISKGNKSSSTEETGKKIAEEMLAFTSERRKTESLNDIIINGLSVFAKIPKCFGASLFLLDNDALQFNFSYSLPLVTKEFFLQEYSSMLKEGIVQQVLKSGKAHAYNKGKQGKNIILFPMIIPTGLAGLILAAFDDQTAGEDPFLIQQLSIHSNVYANLIYNFKTAQEIKNSGEMIEQRITDRTIDLNFQVKELQSILENIQAGMLIINEAAGELINANQAALSIYKCSLIDLKKSGLYKDLIDKGGRKAVINKAENYPDEATIIDANGYQVLVIKKETKLFLFGKKILLISLLDISEKKAAQRLIKQNEERYHKLADNMIDLICEVDKKGNILYVSPSYKSILGYDEAELIGINSFELIHPDDRPRICEKFLAYIKLGIGGRDELRTKHKDGHFIWIETIGQPFYSEEGKHIGAILSSRDVSSRKESEEALRKSEEQFRYIWKSSLDGMILLDSRGTILMVNDAFCKLVEMDKSELEKKSFEIIHDEADRKRIRAIFEEEISFNKVEPYTQSEFTLWNKKKVWFQISSSILFQGGARAQVLSLYRNISNQKRLEQELMDINVQKDKFFSIMAHDLKSPFNGLMGLTKYLVDNYSDLSSEEARELLIDVNSSSFYIYNLLENLLSWSRIQMDRMEFNPMPINISNLAKNNINLLRNNAQHKGISLIDDTFPDINAYADEFMINSCILNLISNSIKFTPKGGKVAVRSYRQENKAYIEVCDSGVGMSKEVAENIFKIDSIHSTIGTANEKGTGLGLKIAKELIEKNNGRIFIESTPGKGSVIKIELDSY